MIEKDEVSAVAIRSTTLVGLKKGGSTAAASFPENGYDFETTIGDDFLETVIKLRAAQLGKDADTLTVADLSFTVQYRAPVTVPWYYEFLPFVLMIVVMGAIWYFMMRSQGGGGKMMSFGNSKARLQDPRHNKVTFADVAGADEEKEELQEMVDFLRNPKAYT